MNGIMGIKIHRRCNMKRIILIATVGYMCVIGQRAIKLKRTK